MTIDGPGESKRVEKEESEQAGKEHSQRKAQTSDLHSSEVIGMQMRYSLINMVAV